MKKILQALFLISFIAVLLVPAIIFAAECPSCQVPTAQCTCGGATLSTTGGLYCYNSTTFNALNLCQAAMGGSSTGGGGYQEIPTNVPSSPAELLALIERIGNWIFTGLLSLAAIFMVVAGYYFVTASGNAEKINQARNILIQALIGVAVGLASKGLVMIIRGFILK